MAFLEFRHGPDSTVHSFLFTFCFSKCVGGRERVMAQGLCSTDSVERFAGFELLRHFLKQIGSKITKKSCLYILLNHILFSKPTEVKGLYAAITE